MNTPELYAVLLGGKIRKNNLMEDHHLVFVVAESEKEARSKAKEKWDAEEIHIDGTQKIISVDGYDISISKNSTTTDDVFEMCPNYSE